MHNKDQLIGQQLGDYVIQGILGHGGMARVYKGYDVQLNRYAAVKVIEPHLIAGDNEQEYRERFLKEARAIARLHHPNIVSIFQFGEHINLYYMAMGFIQGRDLREILRKHIQQGTFMSNAQVLRIIRDTASALDYAHQQGVIHRDVKPSNIMIAEEDGRAVLTDFGLALSAQEGTSGNTFGSVHYISPEQAVSSAEAVPQSDLYSLGVMLFEMLTGQVPFTDSSAMSVALKHISDPPPLPRSINPKIASEVENVVIKLLNKEPAQRFASGQAVVEALELAFTGSVRQVPVAATFEDQFPTSGRLDVIGTSTTDLSGPETLPFAPLDDEDTEVFPKPPERDSRTMLAAGFGIVLVVVVIVVLLVLSGTLGGGDEDATPTVGASVATQDRRATMTPSPTDDEPASTDELIATSTNTPMPSNSPVANITPTPEINALVRNDPQVLLRYDDRTLVLYNRWPDQFINIIDLSFVYEPPIGRTVTFRASEWNNASDLRRMRSQDCFQVWTTQFRSLPASEFPADICQTRQGFLCDHSDHFGSVRYKMKHLKCDAAMRC